MLFSLNSYADKVYQEGVLFLNNGDSLECSIRVYRKDVLIGVGKLQYIENSKKGKVAFSKIDSIRLGNFNYRFLNYLGTELDDLGDEQTIGYRVLVREEIGGASVLYKEFNIETYPGEVYIIINGYKSMGTSLGWNYHIELEGKSTKINAFRFKKTCTKIYENNINIVNKLENKEFRIENIRDLVIYANQEIGLKN